MMIKPVTLVVIAAVLLTISGFRHPFPRNLRRNTLVFGKVEVADSKDIKENERKVVSTPNGELIIANLGGKFFAVNAKCPHQGKSMKIGKIENGSLGPTITCNFHDAKFSLVNGQCKAWCSNVGMVDRMKPSGKENSPATVYPCAVEKGKVVVTL